MEQPDAAGRRPIAKFVPQTLSSDDEKPPVRRDGKKYAPMVLSSEESNGEGPSHGDKLQASAPISKRHGKLGNAPKVLSSSESQREGARRGKMAPAKRLPIPRTLSDSDEDVEVIAERPAPHSARTKQKLQGGVVKREYVPITLSDVEFEVVSAPAATAGHKASPGASKFTPMVLSSGESDDGFVSPTVMMQEKSGPAVKKEVIPQTLSDSESEGEQRNRHIAVAEELTPAEAQDETEDDAMSVDLDALADRINNAPAYGNYNFDHITDNMLEPEDGNGEDDDEDNTEGHEYDEETSDDAEYDTDEEEV